jgi:hypothetical protein
MPAVQLTSGEEGPGESGELDDSYSAELKLPLGYPRRIPDIGGDEGGDERKVGILDCFSIGFETRCDFKGKSRVREELFEGKAGPCCWEEEGVFTL